MKIYYTEHSIERMRQRDIVEEDVEEAFMLNPSVQSGKSNNRYEIHAKIGRRFITVVYTKISDGIRIITVF
ncbi:MAG: DUF4258 domain-containing protein [bacterium]|nr:DUF4258 domain-containing protein [bacterium]